MKQEFDDRSFEIELENAILNVVDSDEQDAITAPEHPDELFIFPVLRRPFFPGMAAPIIVETGPYYQVLKQLAKSEDSCLALVLTKKETVDIHKLKGKDLHRVGVLARILKIIPMEKGVAQVILDMEKRLKIEKIFKDHKHLKAKVSYYEDELKGTLSDKLKAYSISIISTIKELLKHNPLFKEELQIFLSHSDFSEPGKLADFAVTLTTATREELQEVLETFSITKRIEKALALLKKELDLSRLQHSINKKIESTITKGQKDFFLREQLKTIKKELGIERDEKSIDRDKFNLRLKNRKVSKDVMTVINEEMEKLGSLEPQSAEYAISRSYLDWLTILPWGIQSKECLDLVKAEKILQKDHYDLDDIKKRILEFIGVGKLVGSVKGSIICLVGPPGVGKTSVGRSIARALNRKFYRFSVGGMRDEAEIKGHRRTYIGAMPGKVVQALKYCQTVNPVIMLDEVDKMVSSYHGDPASALLEVLDPEQNREFQDYYMDVRCDLSNVLFIVTANVLDTIPEPLLDRMEILRLSGYITEDKVQIAKKYLIPRNRKLSGLKASQISFTSDGIRHIINGYARESGVRSLENNIKKILRKIALKIAKEIDKAEKKKKKIKEKKYIIIKDTISEYLGNPIFISDRFYERTPIGVCTGLAWTALGGATLYIETVKVPGEKTKMILTGQAGQVMQESSQIAWTYLHSAIHKYAPGFTFFENAQVHFHIPEGATPKDGPSAGITMVTALLSLLTETLVVDDLGMTGELTLTGRILPVGGIKEKVVAAKRSGLKELIFPKENLRDYEELPDYLKKGLNTHFVNHYDEVFHIAFQKKVL